MKTIKTKRKLRQRINLGLHLFIVLFFLAMTTSCTPTANHEILTFFFTGVPLEDEAKASNEHASAQGGKIKEETINYSLSSHSYFIQNSCDECHKSLSSSWLGRRHKTIQETGSAGNPNLQSSEPLIVSCQNCHNKLTAKYAAQHNLWRHAPIT